MGACLEHGEGEGLCGHGGWRLEREQQPFFGRDQHRHRIRLHSRPPGQARAPSPDTRINRSPQFHKSCRQSTLVVTTATTSSSLVQ